MLEELKKTAQKEKYYEGVEEEYTALEEKINKDKSEDLQKFKDEISNILENEIVSRYYFQNGRIEQSLATDIDIKEAINNLSDRNKHNSILAGTFTSENE